MRADKNMSLSFTTSGSQRMEISGDRTYFVAIQQTSSVWMHTPNRQIWCPTLQLKGPLRGKIQERLWRGTRGKGKAF